MLQAFLTHTKCPASITEFVNRPVANGDAGFFKYDDLRLFGKLGGGLVSTSFLEPMGSADLHVSTGDGVVYLPFNLTEIIENLRQEKYVGAVNSEVSYISDKKSMFRRIYYSLRPLFPVFLRRILQRVALKNWSSIPFPKWPVDTTIEELIEKIWILVLQASGEDQIPFIWYWPKGFSSCAMMTHDVETHAGQNFSHRILEIEKDYDIKSSFEFVPEVRYKITDGLLKEIRAAGSEVCIHGLNHDGGLFKSEKEFRKRARKINEYARKYEASGFRSPVMYRNQAWYDALEFSYDMSVPNVGHLDPQRGGCCTVFPYFIGNVLELPLTTIQDYPVYNILRADPMKMWTEQLNLILSKHGLASFIVHPDYTIGQEKQDLYKALLSLLRRYHTDRKMFLALPKEVDMWWRQRHKMTLTQKNGKWIIEGEGAEKAVIAFASMKAGKIRYRVQN